MSKARQHISIAFRGFISRNLNFTGQAFVKYMRSVLEFASIVWNPFLFDLTDLIENVRRNFSKHVPSFSSLVYPERMALLDLESLELRRSRFHFIQYFNYSPF